MALSRLSAIWPEASVRCLAAIRPESGVKPTCRDGPTDAIDPEQTSPPALRLRSAALQQIDNRTKSGGKK
jgi:hypothetical protein